MKRKITQGALLEFAKKNAGNYFPTVARSRPFMVDVRDGDIVCYPESKRDFWLSPEKQIPRFNETNSYRPNDYPGETFTNSYFVGLVHAMLNNTKPIAVETLPPAVSKLLLPSSALDEEVARLRKIGITLPPIGQNKPRKRSVTTEQFYRDPEVKTWVLQTSKGYCDYCEEKAPFQDDHNLPFLEVHHVIPLGEGGPDTISNAVALCPNCHRAMHHAKERRKYVAELYQRYPRLKKQ
jgi:5-methylcytosine-specific restriction endonuclease McrA